jgi:hypothetical protein
MLLSSTFSPELPSPGRGHLMRLIMGCINSIYAVNVGHVQNVY